MSNINFLNVEMNPVDAYDEDSINCMIFEFKPKEEDYLLRQFVTWDVIKAKIFKMKIGNSVFSIPSSFYIMIGDSYGELDWMMVDEMINREVDCVSLDGKMETWDLHQPELVDVREEVVHWPMTQNIIPCESNRNVILLSRKDQFHMTKNFLIDSFLLSV